ncbi:DUF6520 family protein [Flavobacterium shii]|uniref:DUF6520 family protein n=1 Tax=Flavobacterium shii TaxID=2987687 RepID=UPI00384B06E8
MPVAVFVLAISGAFLTTSMQSEAKVDDDPILGYVTVPGAPCSIEVECSTDQGDACRLFDDEGPQAFAKDSPTTCTEVVYRP